MQIESKIQIKKKSKRFTTGGNLSWRNQTKELKKYRPKEIPRGTPGTFPISVGEAILTGMIRVSYNLVLNSPLLRPKFLSLTPRGFEWRTTPLNSNFLKKIKFKSNLNSI